MPTMFDIGLFASTLGTLAYGHLEFYLSQRYVSKLYMIDRVQNYDADYINDLSIIPIGKHVAIKCLMSESVNLQKDAYWLNTIDPVLFGVSNTDPETNKMVKSEEELVISPKSFPVITNITSKSIKFEVGFESLDLAHRCFNLSQLGKSADYKNLTGKIEQGYKYTLIGMFDKDRIYRVKYVTPKNKEAILMAVDNKAYLHKQRGKFFLAFSIGAIGSAFVYKKLS